MKKVLALTIISFVAVFLFAYYCFSLGPQESINKANTLSKAKSLPVIPVMPIYINPKAIPIVESSSQIVPAKEQIETREQSVEQPNAKQAITEFCYPLHKDIVSTIFWVGEASSEDNGYIANSASAWDSFWQEHFGGFDDPENRTGYNPAGFQPKENPFYIALPYNDFDENGQRKNNVNEVVYWAKNKTWTDKESMLKNNWVKIIKNDKTVYAQWEDSGPFIYDDHEYVFGSSRSQNEQSSKASIDVSPAVRDYLQLKDIDQVDWQFIDYDDVPDGPWKNVVTTTQLSY